MMTKLTLSVVLLLSLLVLASCSEDCECPTIPEDVTVFEKTFQNGMWPHESYDGVRDTHISEEDPGASPGSSSSLTLASGDARRILMIFDLLGQLPPDVIIQKATLTMVGGSSCSGDISVVVQELTRPWSESSAGWDHSGIDSWVGGAANAEVIGSFDGCPDSGTTVVSVDLDPTAVHGWLEHSIGNYGIRIRVENETESGYEAYFSSSEDFLPHFRPSLTVYYTVD